MDIGNDLLGGDGNAKKYIFMKTQLAFIFCICAIFPLELFSQDAKNFFPEIKTIDIDSILGSPEEKEFNFAYLTLGFGFGTTSNKKRAFGKGTYNFDFEGSVFTSINYFSLGVGCHLNLFPRVEYDDKPSDITFATISSELIFYTQKNKGLFFGAAINYPFLIDDSEYFDTFIYSVPGDVLKKTRFFTPSYRIGYAFETKKGMREVSLSYETLKYRNVYKLVDDVNGIYLRRKDTLSFAQIQLSIKANLFKKPIQ